jgi:hypothetical protein
MKEEPQVQPKRRRFYADIATDTAFMVALGQTHTFRVAVYQSPDAKEDDLPAHDVTLVQIGSTRISLTALTEEELRALYEGMKLAIFYALPTVRMLDKEAQDAYQTGTAARRRLYRRAPVIALKRRMFGSLAEGIQERFGRVVDLDRARSGKPDATGLAASGRSRLAIPERGQKDPGSSDGEPEAGGDEDLGQSTRQREVPGEVPGTEDS